MKTLFVKGLVLREDNGFAIKTFTRSDDRNLSMFLEEVGNKPIDISFKDISSGKTYDQLKTVFALGSIIHESMFFRKPSDSENHRFVNDLLEMFGEKRKNLLDPTKETPLNLSEMNRYQLGDFIYKLCNFIIDVCSLPKRLDIEVQELFLEWQDWRSSRTKDVADMDENGSYLSLQEWKERNNFSFASGISNKAMPLEVAHIVSRGADKEDIDEVWNLIMLTHYEHIEIMHKKGWNAFLEIYPHLRGRVERARNLAGKLKLI